MTDFQDDPGGTAAPADAPGSDAAGPAAGDDEARSGLPDLTPREIVSALDEYVIGQDDAKRSVAIALRNRWRRRKVEGELQEEILPNNIILIGPTGVGKTEIARRLARLAGAPFIKIEASKFTEVGYVGRDVESMVRDLVGAAVNLIRSEKEEAVEDAAEERVEERLLDLLLPPASDDGPGSGQASGGAASGSSGGTGRRFVVSSGGQAAEESGPGDGPGEAAPPEGEDAAAGATGATAAGTAGDSRRRTRQKIRDLLRAGKLEDRTVEVEVTESSAPMLDLQGPGMEGLEWNLGEMLGEMMPKKTKRREVTVAEARRILMGQELDRLVDQDEVVDEALDRAETMGIIFLDELDKVAVGRGEGGGGGPDVSREGVQRDMLPIVEGSTVQTKYGMVDTDHILFIAAGAFHVADPSDLIPELQGRFPIRVELHKLGEEEFARILREPRNALLTQYRAMVRSEGAELEFTDDAVQEIARVAAEVNDRSENIGARRLHTVLTTLLDHVMFGLPEEGGGETIRIDAEEVRERLADIVDDEDLRRYIL